MRSSGDYCNFFDPVLLCQAQSLQGSVQSFGYGALDVRLIGYDADGQFLCQADGKTTLSLDWLMSYRLVAACAGLNLCLAILSIIALMLVVKRRFELFSFCSLLVLTCVSATIGVTQTWRVAVREGYVV